MTANTNASAEKTGGQQERRQKTDRRKNEDRRAQKLMPGVEKTIPDGGFVFREYETAQEAFIVKSGTIEISKSFPEEGHEARNVTLGTLQAGAMFGEMALIDDELRMASARAVGGPVELYVISRKQFESKLNGVNLFISKLLQILAGNVRSSSEKVK